MKPAIVQKTPLANRVWAYYRKRLEEAGRWEDRYAAQFTVLVMAIVGYLETTEKLVANGFNPILTSPKGSTYTNPLLNVQAQYINTIKTFGAAFGLNPLADARLKAVPNAAEAMGSLFEFLKGPPGGE